MATIIDVARQAGVSKTLVSRYLNGQPGVSAASRQKIVAAIEALNYRPNELARSLVLQRTHTIGIVVDDLRSPFLFRLIEGLERGAEEFDGEDKYNVIYCNANGDIARKERHIRFLTQGRVDGIVLYGSLVHDDTLIRRLAKDNFPFLLIENDIDGLDAHKIVIDNVGGAMEATEHLIALGHRDILHIAGNRHLKITQDRLQGYEQALRKHGIAPRESAIAFPDFSDADQWMNRDDGRGQTLFYDRGYVEMKRLIAGDRVPQAIFFATDLSAYGAMRALQEAGLSVPGDVSIVGFDDEVAAAGMFGCRPITTVRQPLREAGYRGIQQLIAGLRNPEASKERIVLATELVVRDSTRQAESRSKS